MVASAYNSMRDFSLWNAWFNLWLGSKLLGGVREAGVLRKVRDASLVQTEAGRAWIDLFERTQGAALEVVLDDEELARESAGLLERAAAVVDGDEPLGAEDVERAYAFLDRVGRAATDEDVKSGLEAVSARLREVEGRAADEIVEDLMKRPPGGGGKGAAAD